MRSSLVLLAASVAALAGPPAASAADPADLAITQSIRPQADGAGFLGAGGWASFALTVANHGPSAATGVTVTDALPSPIRYVSSSYGCHAAGQTVTCDVGTLAAGASITVEIVGHHTAFSFRGPLSNAADVTSAFPDPHPADNLASSLANVYNHEDTALFADHHVYVEHVETPVGFGAGETRTVTLTCGSEAQVIDGDLQVDAVDQGTGTLRAVRVDAARALDSGDFSVTATNTAGGRAQGKAFGVCIPRSTGPGSDGHRHLIGIGASRTATVEAPHAGRYDVTVTCGSDQIGAAPGFTFTDGAHGELVRSEPSPDTSPGWTFGIDVTAPGRVVASVRCLDRDVSIVPWHYHELWLSHPDTVVDVPAHSTGDYVVSCSDEAKGIVASFDLPAGVHLAGHDPEVKSRRFRLVNATDSDQQARLDLICVGDRTGIDPLPVASATDIADAAQTASSGSTVSVDVTCPALGCSGQVELTAIDSGAVARAASAASSRRLGSTLFGSRRGGRVTVRVPVSRSVRRSIRAGRLRAVRARVFDAHGKTVERRTLRVKRRHR